MHVQTMTTSLSSSVGVVDTIEWACVLCGCHIQNDWMTRATNLHQIFVEFDHSSMETIQMIQEAFQDDAMSAVQIKVWHRCFRDSHGSVESDPHSGRPVTSRTLENVECVRAAINKDQPMTVWELEADLGIPKLLCPRFWCRILTWDVLWHNLVRGFCFQSRRTIGLQLLMTRFKPLPMNQISSRRS